MSEKRIALFGGTFDPIHLGHTTVAAAAGEGIGADKVIFVPAKRSPLKAFFPEAGDEDRLAMIKLATEGDGRFELERLRAEEGGAELYARDRKIFSTGAWEQCFDLLAYRRRYS